MDDKVKLLLATGAIVLTAAITGCTNTGSSSSATNTVYKDGTYAGSADSNIYGTVQVQAVISGGKISDIQFLSLPNAAPHTQEVSSSSSPILKQEAITANSSNVDIVSGATQTSQSFIQSLGAALQKAQ